MHLSDVAKALNLDRQFLLRRIEQLQKEMEFCQQILDSMGNEDELPVADDTSFQSVVHRSLKKLHRLSRDDYFDATVEYLAENGPSTAGKIYDHLRALGKKVSYDSVAAFLRREHIRHRSRITKDPVQAGTYLLKRR